MRRGLCSAGRSAYICPMISRLLSSLLAPEPGRLAAPDAQVALAALLVRVARADENYEEAERLV